MTTQIDIPQNTNYLSPLGFALVIDRAPHLSYFLQEFRLPAVSMVTKDRVATPFIDMNVPGDKLQFDDIVFQYQVDEDMKTYTEIFDWMVSLTFPENFDQATSYPDGTGKNNDGMYSDASVFVLSSNHRPALEIRFKDMYPVALSELEFDSKLSDVDYIQATVKFEYRSFTITKL